jgi:hypothetical protein
LEREKGVNFEFQSFGSQYPELKFTLGFLKFYFIIVCTWHESAFKYFHLFVPVIRRISCTFFMKKPMNPVHEKKGIEDTCFL